MPQSLTTAALAAAFYAQLVVACSPKPPAQEPSTTVTSPIGSVDAGGTPSTMPSASAAGAPANAPTTEKMCGGIAGVQCPDKHYCSYAPEAHCGAADMSGTCAPIPEVCTEQLDEVCGCDDKTYGNPCKAAQAGVSVVMKGACAKHEAPGIAEGALCGTRGVPGDCAPDLYCAYKSDCGATDAGGTCKKKPTMCTKIYKPVCGCDNKTYGSACTAAAAGVSVLREGQCKR